MIYFIQAQYTKFIKIGSSKDAKERLKTLQRQNSEPISILKVIEGTHLFETYIQKYFKEFNIHHEWFYPAGPILSLINSDKAINEMRDKAPKKIKFETLYEKASRIDIIIIKDIKAGKNVKLSDYLPDKGYTTY